MHRARLARKTSNFATFCRKIENVANPFLLPRFKLMPRPSIVNKVKVIKVFVLFCSKNPSYISNCT